MVQNTNGDQQLFKIANSLLFLFFRQLRDAVLSSFIHHSRQVGDLHGDHLAYLVETL